MGGFYLATVESEIRIFVQAKLLDTHVNSEIWLYFTMQKNLPPTDIRVEKHQNIPSSNLIIQYITLKIKIFLIYLS